MGVTKTENFTERQNQLSGLLKALAHPARVAIIEHLMKVNTCICGDLVQELALAQPTISQHLKELKQAGIIQGTVEGPSVCYCLKPDAFEAIAGFLQEISYAINQQKSNCC